MSARGAYAWRDGRLMSLIARVRNVGARMERAAPSNHKTVRNSGGQSRHVDGTGLVVQLCHEKKVPTLDLLQGRGGGAKLKVRYASKLRPSVPGFTVFCFFDSG